MYKYEGERLLKTLYPCLRYIRIAMGLTQRDFADRLGLSTEYYRRLENGFRGPTRVMLLAVTKVIDDYILFHRDYPFTRIVYHILCKRGGCFAKEVTDDVIRALDAADRRMPRNNRRRDVIYNLYLIFKSHLKPETLDIVNQLEKEEIWHG